MTDNQKNFEEQFKLLNEELKKIESKDIGLSESIDSYERAVKLFKNCELLLNEAKLKVETISESLIES